MTQLLERPDQRTFATVPTPEASQPDPQAELKGEAVTAATQLLQRFGVTEERLATNTSIRTYGWVEDGIAFSLAQHGQIEGDELCWKDAVVINCQGPKARAMVDLSTDTSLFPSFLPNRARTSVEDGVLRGLRGEITRQTRVQEEYTRSQLTAKLATIIPGATHMLEAMSPADAIDAATKQLLLFCELDSVPLSERLDAAIAILQARIGEEGKRGFIVPGLRQVRELALGYLGKSDAHYTVGIRQENATTYDGDVMYTVDDQSMVRPYPQPGRKNPVTLKGDESNQIGQLLSSAVRRAIGTY